MRRSKFNRFVLVSFLIHILMLLLFGYRETETVAITSLTVDISSAKLSSSGVSSSAGLQRSPTPNKNNSSQKAVADTKKTKTTQTSESSQVSKKSDMPTLLRNNPPPGGRRSASGLDRVQEEDKTDRQITLDKSKNFTRSSSQSSPAASTGGGGSGSEGSPDSGFGEKSVFGKSASGSSTKSFNLDSDSGGGSSGSESSSDSGGKGFNWKGLGQRKLVSSSELVFPKRLEGKGIDEDVLVAFKVAPDGRVYEIELLKSSGYSELDNAVKDQVRSFRFNTVNTDKVNEAEYRYRFKLVKK